MGNLIVGFIIGFCVATVGVSSFASYVDRHVDQAREIVKENVK
jgi:hypothetical protein